MLERVSRHDDNKSEKFETEARRQIDSKSADP